MKLALNKYKHNEKGFQLEVTGAGKRLVTTRDLDSNEVVKFNRGKFEWMIKKGVFSQIGGE